jgi:hypothetical protein
MLKVKRKEFIIQFNKWSWAVLLIACYFQLIAFSSTKNIIAIAYVLFAWILSTKFIFVKQFLLDFTLSTFLLIGFTLTQFYFPLIFTSLENKPLVFNLELPNQVFLHSTLALIILIFSHWIYRTLVRRKHRVHFPLLNRLGLFKSPSIFQIWLMGIIGLLSTFYVYIISPKIGWSVTGSPVDKLIQALIPFSYAPFFIPFSAMYGDKIKITNRTNVFLVIFFFILIFLSVGRNSRGGFMIGFTSLGLAYFLGLMLGIIKPKIITFKNLCLVCISFWLVTGPIADLGTAMVNVREKRRDISPEELLVNTLNAFNDKKAIKTRRLEDNKMNDDWDERYLNNIFTARFCNLKFNDECLVIANKIGYENPQMREFSLNYIIATLPQPLLNFLNINIDKKSLQGISFGDYLYYLTGHYEDALGSFRTGHFSGTGMATFGWWYLLLLGLGIIPVYFLLDILKMRFDNKNFNPRSRAFQIRISFCGMLTLDTVFRFLPFESIVSIGVFIIRDWIQLIILYLLVYHTTKYLDKLILNRSNNVSYQGIKDSHNTVNPLTKL